MKIEAVHTQINSFPRPEGYDKDAWAALKGKALAIWIDYLDGQLWEDPVDIPCMEFYLMLLDHDKELILPNKEQLRWIDNVFTRRWVIKYLKSGIHYLRSKNYEKALKFFQAVVQINSSSYQGWFYSAFAKQRLLRYQEALQEYNLAIALEPQNEHGYIQRARLYSLLDMDEKALLDLNQAVRINPHSANAYLQRSKFRKLLDDAQGAKEDFEMAYRLDPVLTSQASKGKSFNSDSSLRVAS